MKTKSLLSVVAATMFLSSCNHNRVDLGPYRGMNGNDSVIFEPGWFLGLTKLLVIKDVYTPDSTGKNNILEYIDVNSKSKHGKLNIDFYKEYIGKIDSAGNIIGERKIYLGVNSRDSSKHLLMPAKDDEFNIQLDYMRKKQSINNNVDSSYRIYGLSEK